jgi:hypothetical protein
VNGYLKRHAFVSVPLAIFWFSAVVLVLAQSTSESPSRSNTSDGDQLQVIKGVVVDDVGPVAGAVVRLQAAPHATITDGQGRFVLTTKEAVLDDGERKLTAWAHGYYCGGPASLRLGGSDVRLLLRKHFTKDNPDYAWLPSTRRCVREAERACSDCHCREGSGLAFNLPADDWLLDAHGQSATNPRFLTMYAGTDVNGRKSAITRRTRIPEYGEIPLPPSRDKTYFGPGYRLDYPETAGNCAACHAPAAAVEGPYGTDPRAVSGVGAEGVACDVCHKVWSVRLDARTGLPSPNRPGILSYEFRRPPDGHQFFAGPYDDVATGEDTYSPLQRESQFCAGCHFGVFWDTVAYNSFGEWLASPYSDPDRGRTCQDCHMPSVGATYVALPSKGGMQRDPETIHCHRMPGAGDEALLKNAVTMQVRAHREKDRLLVEATLTNDRTGHHVPTGSPLRQVLLVLKVMDAEGNAQPQIDGPVLPIWCGEGKPDQGYYAGLPGKAFAKILQDRWTGETPTPAYWNPTRVVNDNRLAAFATDKSRYVFVAPKAGTAIVEAKLLFRRAFKQLMDQKGWRTRDIVMQHARLAVD